MKAISFGMIAGALLIAACNPETESQTSLQWDADHAGLSLPSGFQAIKVADSTGNARHIAVNKKGEIFLKMARPQAGKGILMLTDSDGDGKADQTYGFADYGGTGILIYNHYLYASSNTDVYRYKLNDKQQVEAGTPPEIIVTGLIDRNQHNSKSIAIDPAGNLYVNIGAYSNACQEVDRVKGSIGMKPCPILDSAGGIWKFKADVANQTFSDGQRYATGLRNVVGLDWNTQTNSLFVMQHGRDNLNSLYPEMFNEKQSADLPAEVMFELQEGADAGWPYIYHDPYQKKKIVAPEYGGDGQKEGGEGTIDPVVYFPAHLAPNALLFYKGNLFPEKYRNGAFIAFHGSWNRAPEKQAGYFVAFVPFANGKPSGEWEIFADGFSGQTEVMAPGQALHRPCGLAEGPDGSLYISDSVTGAVYRISYNGK